MATPNPFDPDDDLNPTTGTDMDADVVDLDKARARRAPRPDSTGDGDDLADDADAESFDDAPPGEGGPVDMAEDIPAEVYARQQTRRPILAEWARSRRSFEAAVRHSMKDAGYVAAYH